jgi:hypothetical protein
MIDRLRTDWDGLVILAILSALAAGLFAMGYADAGGVVIAIMAGQVLPPPVRLHRAGDQ